ncbi:hypothetical protein RFI_13058 [Reticulomyxa filosa]|uniref:Uncharacterized protein n=1 Tax=Reticulomyxa filosa TaxID=46433 RepID=X6NDM2_RETFI|nr:hypothetical protein RFI_13058 [Reticulomyxa filosa]|eukprot:ETO24101.1 hypothetical protein RFI_13058 [Reticulomyxa filosa]
MNINVVVCSTMLKCLLNISTQREMDRILQQCTDLDYWGFITFVLDNVMENNALEIQWNNVIGGVLFRLCDNFKVDSSLPHTVHIDRLKSFFDTLVVKRYVQLSYVELNIYVSIFLKHLQRNQHDPNLQQNLMQLSRWYQQQLNFFRIHKSVYTDEMLQQITESSSTS